MQENKFNEVVLAVKRQVSIVNIIGGYIALKKKGNKFWGCCPFHNEKTASFTVSEEKGFFYCFGCHAGGDAISFLMRIRQMTFPEVIKDLAEQFNIPLPQEANSFAQEKVDAVAMTMLEANKQALEFYQTVLKQQQPLSEAARKYLSGRGIGLDIISKFSLGLSTENWQDLYHHLQKSGFADALLQQVGLVGQAQSGRIYDKFRQRIIIPIFNTKGEVIAFGGRVLASQDNPKYLNSQETKVFNKRKTLYALNVAQTEIKKQGFSILVEGYMDAISMHTYGFSNTVASLGTAFSMEQARLLGRYSRKVLMAYDNDSAGIQATIRAIDIARENFLQVRVVLLAPAKDPDEFLQKYGPHELQKRINNSIDAVEYQIEQTIKLNQKNNSLQEKVEILAKVLEFVKKCENSLEIDSYLQTIASGLLIDMAIVKTEYNKLIGEKLPLQTRKSLAKQAVPHELNAIELAQRHIIKIILEDVSILEYVTAQLLPKDFAEKALAEIFMTAQILSMDNQLNIDALLGKLSETSQTKLLSILAEDIQFADPIKLVDDCIRQIKYSNLEQEYNLHSQLAVEYEKTGDERFINELQQVQEIRKQLKKFF